MGRHQIFEVLGYQFLKQTRSDINICQIFLLVCLFICCVRMIDIFGLSNEFSDILQATDVKVFCLFAAFVCLFVQMIETWMFVFCWYLWSLKSFNIIWVQLYLGSKVWHQQMPNLIKGNPPADSVTQFRRGKMPPEIDVAAWCYKWMGWDCDGCWISLSGVKYGAPFGKNELSPLVTCNPS